MQDIRKLNKLVEAFRTNKIHGEKFQKAVFDFYTNSQKTIEVENKILHLVESQQLSSINWVLVFQPAPEMCRKIELTTTRLYAERLHSENISDDLIMKNVALHAYKYCANSCLHKEPNFYDADKEKIWLDTFEKSPNFKMQLEQIKNEHKEVEKKLQNLKKVV